MRAPQALAGLAAPGPLLLRHRRGQQGMGTHQAGDSGMRVAETVREAFPRLSRA
ncbi:MAG: hypothetical protein M5U14_09460 [Acidimicrobiia bacterium]|nr:hypothetical protein [Acidimicrobiia bacterium]